MLDLNDYVNNTNVNKLLQTKNKSEVIYIDMSAITYRQFKHYPFTVIIKTDKGLMMIYCNQKGQHVGSEISSGYSLELKTTPHEDTDDCLGR